MLEIAQQKTAEIQISRIFKSVINTKAFIKGDRLARGSDIYSTSKTHTKSQPNQADGLPFTLNWFKKKGNTSGELEFHK